MCTPERFDERILVLAPVGRDAALAKETLRGAGIAADICSTIDEVGRHIAGGAGGLLLTQEALADGAVGRLIAVLAGQPLWSDLPVVVLVSGGALTPALASLSATLDQRVNATFLERPMRSATLVNAMQMALRARRRQYDLRSQLLARAQAEEAERQARVVAEEAVRVRDEFLSSVAHDLKNPLSGIKGYAQLLRRQATKISTSESDVLAQGLGSIDAMVTKAVAQIDQLLDLARLQANQPLPLNLNATDLVALTRRSVAEYQHLAKGHQILMTTEMPEIIGIWDELRLERVLGNLISNAIKYSPDGGAIRVDVRQHKGPEGYAVLVVEDQGMGIPDADLPHIFERFYRASNSTRQAGTGLGLAGVRQIVEQHGGTISVTSTLQRGSCFTVWLPLIPSGVPATGPAPDGGPTWPSR